ncbi:S-layer homology domain-containing protein [Brevibacillus agri]|uniref:Ig-like domain-containing protein n=1 Tax=Brevibacillus agri TaxID=51101 RepID=UPI001C8EB4F1|nr:Ig-like domain-containing protein [Brevibacillus agri]MBY0051215.1 S-layer homology domain-containing protein [Brevibacillus agri]
MTIFEEEVKVVPTIRFRKTAWIPAILSFLLLITTILPMGAGVVHAAGGGISFIGISENTSPSNPHISYSSKITIQGTYFGIVGEDLRYRVLTMNGTEPNDTSSMKPKIDTVTRTFSFSDIELTPGVNQIKFEVKNGDATTFLPVIYVQYNNTPLFSNLKLNSVLFESDPTIVEVTSSSTRKLTLALSGKALNADTVVAENETTGQTFSDSANSSGSFSIDLEGQIGLNKLNIRAFSKNKEVALVSRTVLVLPKSNVQGGADQFYGVTITEKTSTTTLTKTEINKVPPAKSEVVQIGTSASSNFEITGNLLIKVGAGTTILDGSVKDTVAPEAPTVHSVLTSDTTVKGIAEAGSTVIVKKDSSTLVQATASANGSFSVTLPATQPAGTVLTVTAKDAAKNESIATSVTVTTAPDTTPPMVPTVAPVTVSATKVQGNAEAGSTIIVKVGSHELGRAITRSDQTYEVTIPQQLGGTTLSVISMDAAGNKSAAKIQVSPATPDVTAPDAPEVDEVNSEATVVTGIAEADTTVEVKDASGSLGSAVAKADGTFAVNIAKQTAGTTLTITAKDAADNESAATTKIVTVAPLVPTAPVVPNVATVTSTTILDTDTTISGTTDVAGATVLVKKGNRVIASRPADDAKQFSIRIPPQNVGDILSVVAVDTAGNESDAAGSKQVEVKNSNSLELILSKKSSPDVPIIMNPVKGTFEQVANNDLSSEYKLYKVKAEVAGNALKESDGTYQLQVRYKTSTKDPVNLVNTVSDVTVANHSYLFDYKESTTPRFGTVRDVSSSTASPIIQTDGSVNVVTVLPVKVEIDTYNMTATPSSYDVYYMNNFTPVKVDPADYKLTFGSGKMKIEFLKFPSKVTTVKVVYNKGTPSDATDDKEISFKLSTEVVPSLLFYYTVSGQVKIIDSTLEITDPKVSNFTIDSNIFKAKLYNYKLTTGNMKVKLNGTDIGYTLSADPNPDDNMIPFEIQKSKFVNGDQWKLDQGDNTLTFELTNEPNVKFTYNIFFNTEKTPKIQGVKLKVVQGKDDDVELEKKSSDTAYRTSALFLTQFTFDVGNVDPGAVVTIRKDGNVIAKYSMTDESGDWDFLDNDPDYRKSREAAIKGNTSDLGAIFDASTFSRAKDISNKFTFSAEMDTEEYGEELIGELDGDMGLTADELESRLKLFPLTLTKGGTTNYEIEVAQGSIITRQTVSIDQDTQAWTVISPKKLENAPYITVNSNSVPLKIFAEKATKVVVGKTEALAYNTKEPDYKYDPDTGKLVSQTYYVFETNVSLKAGLNTIKYTVFFGNNSFNDEVQIYNVNSAVGGAESRDTLGKKTSFSVFEKAFELKFPSGTVLLAPTENRTGSEINAPATDIFTNVPIYFGIADRTNGRVGLDDDGLKEEMEDLLSISSDFNYASPLYYVDAGNSVPGSGEGDEERAPGGRDPYFDGMVNHSHMRPFIDRYQYNLVPSKVGTVTIKYDSSIVNAANNILTVFYNNGKEWTNLGGVVNTSKKTVTVPFKGFGYYMVMKTRETFSDVINHPFARDAIETLYAKGIMADAPGNGFGTELKITRGEFATMIVKALDLPINDGPYTDSRQQFPAEPTFADVRPSGDDWNYQYKYIETAARAGIVRGKDTRAFFPDDSLTREEAAIMIARALNLKLGTPEAASIALGKMFTDAQLTGYYAAPSVLVVAKAKIMNGEPNDPNAKKPTYRFNPKGDLTRAEMAVITIRIMTQLKKLPK